MVFEVQDGQWIQQNSNSGSETADGPTAVICFICKQTLKPGIEMVSFYYDACSMTHTV